MFRGRNTDKHGAASRGALTGHMDEWEELAVDYIDGQLDPEAKAAVEQHLAGCPECSARIRAQQGALAFLQAAQLDTPPADLEDIVLDEVLFPASPAPTAEGRKVRRSEWSVLWRRRIKPWVPATVAVVAVFVALVSYGVYRSGSGSEDLAATTTAMASTGQAAEDDQTKTRDGENLVAETAGAPEAAATGQDLGATETTAAGQTTAAPTTTAAAAETTTTAGDLTTAAGSITTVAGSFDATATDTPPDDYNAVETTQDKKVMTSSLEDAQTPVCFLLESAAADEEEPGSGTEAAIDLLTELTGLEPLDESDSLQGRLFAAYVARNDATPLVDLLLSIGSSVSLSIGFTVPPPAKMADLVARLSKRGAGLPALSASRTPQPSVSHWSFTTSTSLPADETAGAGDTQTLVEAGTHVLVMIWVKD